MTIIIPVICLEMLKYSHVRHAEQWFVEIKAARVLVFICGMCMCVCVV